MLSANFKKKSNSSPITNPMIVSKTSPPKRSNMIHQPSSSNRLNIPIRFVIRINKAKIKMRLMGALLN